jgi:hypothetical protein
MSLLELLANVERLTGRTLPPGHLLACRAQCRPGPFPDLFAGVLKQAAALVEPFDESVELLAQRPGEPVGGLGRRVRRSPQSVFDPTTLETAGLSTGSGNETVSPYREKQPVCTSVGSGRRS